VYSCRDTKIRRALAKMFLGKKWIFVNKGVLLRNVIKSKIEVFRY
jgi:hypothetical protein